MYKYICDRSLDTKLIITDHEIFEKENWTYLLAITIFYWISPLGQFSHRVAMSAGVSVCLWFCAIGGSFCQSLPLALRSHDQFQTSHWSSKPCPPPKKKKITTPQKKTIPPSPIFFICPSQTFFLYLLKILFFVPPQKKFLFGPQNKQTN